MLAPCEVAVKCVLPAVRAMVAKELMRRYRLRQLDVANRLGVSQSAVSLYGRKIRGRAIDLEKEEEIINLTNGMAASLASGKMQYRDFIIQLCEACRIIRGRGLMCKLHKSFDPSVDPERCELCSLVISKCP